MKISAKIRAYFAFASTMFYVGILIIVLFFNRKRHPQLRKWICKRIFKINDIDFELSGEVDPKAQLLLLNHQSFLDIILLELVNPGNLAWVAKRELFNIPFFGHTVKMPDMIAVDREDKNGLKKLISDAQKRLNQNRIIVIFPEGTRGSGKKILKYKAGAQFIANKLDLVVQPFVISSTLNLLNVKEMLMTPGTIKITALPSFKASEAGKNWIEETRNQTVEIFNRDN